MNSVNETVQVLADDESKVWEGSAYYEDAERWNHIFWGDTSIFLGYFKELDLKVTLELACGHGRHGEHILNTYGNQIDELIMVDILQSNIDFCEERIHDDRVTLIKNDGVRLTGVQDDCCSSIFCYDAMVHFDKDVVRAYLEETYRALRQGGRGLFHHSNYSENSETKFSQNPHARAYMTADLFSSYAEQAGLKVLAQQVVGWGNVPELDCLTLVSK